MTSKRSNELNVEITKLAAIATQKAYKHALLTGNTVLVTDGSDLVEVMPDKSKRVIKHIAPAVIMTKGQIIEIK